MEPRDAGPAREVLSGLADARATVRRMLAALAIAACLSVEVPTHSGEPGSSASRPEGPQAETSELERRARELVAHVGAAPDWPDGLFHPALAAGGRARLRASLARAGTCGAVRGLELLEGARTSGRFRVRLDQGCESLLTLSLEARPPHRVTSFALTAPVPAVADFAELELRLAALPGATSVLVLHLADDGSTPVFAHAAERALGVASAFKLYVLGALVADVADGRRAWNDTLVLAPRLRAPGAGQLASWPAGAPLTLHSLATWMVSASDNTATDHLIDALGRERVEEILGTMGHATPRANEPLLMTRELFLLRGADAGARLEGYLELAPSERRGYLAEELRRLPNDAVDLARVALPEASAPTESDASTPRLDWFASARDLCAALAWLRTASEPASTRTTREILSVARGPEPVLAAGLRPRYVGYKGGQLGGSLSHAWLVRRRDGEWLALAAVWNDPRATLAPERFAGLAAATLRLALEAKLDEAR